MFACIICLQETTALTFWEYWGLQVFPCTSNCQLFFSQVSIKAMKIALWGDNKRRTIPATRNSSSKMTKFGIVILGHTQIQKSVSAILPTYCNIKIAKTFFPPLFGVCKNKLSNVSCISLLRRAVRKKRTIHHVLYIKWGLSQAVWCVCLSCEVLMLHFLCSTHYSHF